MGQALNDHHIFRHRQHQLTGRMHGDVRLHLLVQLQYIGRRSMQPTTQVVKVGRPLVHPVAHVVPVPPQLKRLQALLRRQLGWCPALSCGRRTCVIRLGCHIPCAGLVRHAVRCGTARLLSRRLLRVAALLGRVLPLSAPGCTVRNVRPCLRLDPRRLDVVVHLQAGALVLHVAQVARRGLRPGVLVAQHALKHAVGLPDQF
mmetsp:Transcript_26535/g.57882  ORF Transcript_26535/g.57882 Transcript_26535/m.57882 type:complete len:202 (-) Transcript_26535:327-932(-)